MLTIIVGHVTSTFIPNIVLKFLGSPWNVPVFFIIGGFFLKIESLNSPVSFLRGKFKNLYMPASIIYGINVLLHNIFVYIGWYPLGNVHPASGKPYILYDIKAFFVGLIKVLAVGGSGELTMGAMWFLYSLLYSFVGIAIIYFFISFVAKDDNIRFKLMTVVLLFIAIFSCILSQIYDITINRCSTALTAMFLIWWGMIINKKWKWKFDQWWKFAISVLVFVHCVLMHKGRMVLAHNQYQDIVMLIAGSSACIYMWGFVGKKIESTFVGRFLALMGRESLYLMAFHIIGFFVCNSLLIKMGLISKCDSKGLYTYDLGDNGWLLLLYIIFAIGTSFGMLYCFRIAKTFVLQQIKQE